VFLKEKVYRKLPKKTAEIEFFGFFHAFIIIGYFVSFPFLLMLLVTKIDKDSLTNGFLILFFITAKTIGQYLLKRKKNKYIFTNQTNDL